MNGEDTGGTLVTGGEDESRPSNEDVAGTAVSCSCCSEDGEDAPGRGECRSGAAAGGAEYLSEGIFAAGPIGTGPGAGDRTGEADDEELTLDDIFLGRDSRLKTRFKVDLSRYVKSLWKANEKIHAILDGADDLEEARSGLYDYLETCERRVFEVDTGMLVLEKANVREAVRVFRSIIGPVNEKTTGVSALDCLFKLAKGRFDELPGDFSAGFIMEFINLFRAVRGDSRIYTDIEGAARDLPQSLKLKGREAARVRDTNLDRLAASMRRYFLKFPSGLNEDVIQWRRDNRSRIIRYFRAHDADWHDWHWHREKVIDTVEPLIDLINLSEEEQEAVRRAGEAGVPFGVTPYYLSLIDQHPTVGFDHAVRAQVIPPPDYVDKMAARRADRSTAFDFMGEHDTSPVDLVTRRYPCIAICKPFNTCAQICVYCQRNWEIDGVRDPGAKAPMSRVEAAIDWIRRHPSVGDVLVTGGDPMMMEDDDIEDVLGRIAALPHVYRIRIGTRTPVVLPQRWTDRLVSILEGLVVPGKRQVAVVTHFEHSYEVTPEACEAVTKLRRAGIPIYNQEVFTIENSRRFESVKLRLDLKSIGVDPYYTFNMKGKGETRRYMVPIARILQERKEEARLLPGLDRTDEPVFNVPRLGKNHLRAWQDHRLVMIRPDGARVYEFHPWEKNIAPVPSYNYTDVPIFDYLEELASRGEDIRDYRTIWFYY